MNDRCAGAIEALAWVLEVLPGDLEVKREIEAARDDLLHGVAVDFRRHVKYS